MNDPKVLCYDGNVIYLEKFFLDELPINVVCDAKLVLVNNNYHNRFRLLRGLPNNCHIFFFDCSSCLEWLYSPFSNSMPN